MITGDLDRVLARALAAVGELPFSGGTWRPAPDGSPLAYATSITPGLAARAGRSAGDVAAAVAGYLSAESWITGVRSASAGYLTIEVTPQAVAASAAAMAAAGSACADSTILAGQIVTGRPWPDLTAGPGWQQAWQAQSEAMTGRLAAAAGARVDVPAGPDRDAAVASAGDGDSASGSASGSGSGSDSDSDGDSDGDSASGSGSASTGARPPSPAAAAVQWLGEDPVRYWLARMPPGSQLRSGPPPPAPADPFAAVQQAHAEAASTLRWADDLGIGRIGPGDRLAGLLPDPVELTLLVLLSYLPVRVAAAARRRRPDELPRYLGRLGQAWLECRRARPALPFGGHTAPRDPAVVCARLLLADSVRVVLATGLGLTGVGAADRM